VLANGPIRLVFELTYASWGTARVAETKRVTLDAGTHFNKFESTFKGGKGTLSFAIGIAKHPGGAVEIDDKAPSMRVWEPLNEGKSGNLGTAIVLPMGAKVEAQQTDLDFLLVTPAPKSGPLTYYVGTSWDRTSAAGGAANWTKEVQLLSSRLANPVQIKLAANAAPTPLRLARPSSPVSASSFWPPRRLPRPVPTPGRRRRAGPGRASTPRIRRQGCQQRFGQARVLEAAAAEYYRVLAVLLAQQTHTLGGGRHQRIVKTGRHHGRRAPTHEVHGRLAHHGSQVHHPRPASPFQREVVASRFARLSHEVPAHGHLPSKCDWVVARPSAPRASK